MTEGSVFKFHFSCAHLYHQPRWNDEKNREVFGRCFTEKGHGHNYTLKCVTLLPLEGVRSAQFETSAQEIIKVLDHEHLNFVIPEFKETIPTTENIAKYLFERINKIDSGALKELTLYETDDIWVTIRN